MVLDFSPIQTEILFKLLVATGIGALIGLERELKYSPVGIKTYSIIGLGSCLFTILSGLANQDFVGGIVTGVGFLGAGAIFKSDKGVRGLTTAALVWISAALGMAIGFGYFTLALFGTVIVYVILIIIGYIERKYISRIAQEGGLDIERAKRTIDSLSKYLDETKKHIKSLHKKQKKPSTK
ncbi:MAG: MgtC/SapB family protein [Candidatus Aenigmarchaeota archaeon]|nr:MgtC/SapB family protein [Candidatus Aenigmarchaeota archaeon]